MQTIMLTDMAGKPKLVFLQKSFSVSARNHALIVTPSIMGPQMEALTDHLKQINAQLDHPLLDITARTIERFFPKQSNQSFLIDMKYMFNQMGQNRTCTPNVSWNKHEQVEVSQILSTDGAKDFVLQDMHEIKTALAQGVDDLHAQTGQQHYARYLQGTFTSLRANAIAEMVKIKEQSLSPA